MVRLPDRLQIEPILRAARQISRYADRVMQRLKSGAVWIWRQEWLRGTARIWRQVWVQGTAWIRRQEWLRGAAGIWRLEWVRGATRILSRISGQLYASIGTIVALTLVASLVAWLAFDTIGTAQSEVNETSMPQLAGSFAVAQQGSALAVAAVRLAGAASAEELAELSAEINQQRLEFEIQLSELTNQSGERFESVRSYGGALITNIDALRRVAEERMALRSRTQSLRGELASLDGDVARLSDGAAQFRDRGALAVQLLESALGALDAESLESIEERVARQLTTLSGDNTIVARLRRLGLARDGVIELRAQQFVLDDRQAGLVRQNRNLAADLLNAVERLVDEARQAAASAASASQQAIDSAVTQLFFINGLSIVGAILIGWLLIGRLLAPRLQALSNRMLAMAEGDLEDPVDIGGRDEVAELASALEVFRRHALEVQRLNLVEKLAEELRGKNDQLESALEELRQAQDRIVAREKLAGLGELTAGVAHEISNPLNFVQNFSEVSAELVQELLEELEESQNGFSEVQKELLEPICRDVFGNLERIRSHGGRAGRIVGDMLKMGGSTGSREPTEINGLIDEQINLVSAYQAENDQPAVKLERDFDEKAGEIDIVAQDIARVVQNLIINAWQATTERSRAEQEAGQSYEATIAVGTRNLGDRVEVYVHDNGTGIPDDAVDMIFNPFFTTKPTDEGTGLGLSLCNDIARGHGGSIRVETEFGSHTRMILELPVSRRRASTTAS